MTDKPKRLSHEELLAGEVSQVSIINEPVVDFVVSSEVPKAESAAARARRRWHMEPESREYERE